MELGEYFTKLRRSTFTRSVAVLAGGTAISQLIMVLVLPILTRIYTPNDFSVLAVYTAALSIFSVAACFRFDIAIPMPKRDEEAVSLLVLALIGACFSSLVLLIISFSFPLVVTSTLGKPELEGILWLIPVGVLLTSSYGALQAWNTRKKQFVEVSRTRMAQALAGASTQVGCGLLGNFPSGLLFGQMLSAGAGALGLGYRLARNERSMLKSVRLANLWSVCCQYHRFPKYSTLEALTNSAAIQVPLIIIAAREIGPEAGYLMLAMRIIQAPMGLIGSAISQVYVSRAAEEFRINRLNIFTGKILEGLLRTGVGPIILFGAIAPRAFELVFGGEWQRAGQLVTWMTPWFVMQFLASPISMALHVTGNQRVALLLQIFGFLSRVGMVVTATHLIGGFVSEIYAVSGFVFYFIYLTVILRVSCVSFLGAMAAVKAAFPVLMAWTVLSMASVFLCQIKIW